MKWLFLLFALPLAADFYFFVPPTKWLPVPSQHLKGKVEIGFLSPERKSFRPSINLAVDTYKTTIEKYVEAVKQAHLVDRTKSWRDLGTIETSAGPAHIAQIDYKAPWGEVRALQAFLGHNNTVYLFTGVTHKNDFGLHEKDMIDSIRSFTIATTLPATLKTDEERKRFLDTSKEIIHTWGKSFARHSSKKSDLDQFNTRKFQKHWKVFEQKLLEQFPKMGLHWHARACKTVQDEILAYNENRRFK